MYLSLKKMPGNANLRRMNRGVNLGRFFFFFITESDRALYSRRIAYIASHLFQRRCAITLTWIFTWPRRTTCSYQRCSSIVLRESDTIYYRVLLSRDRAPVKLLAMNRAKFIHVRDESLVDEHLWTRKDRSTHKQAYA